MRARPAPRRACGPSHPPPMSPAACSPTPGRRAPVLGRVPPAALPRNGPGGSSLAPVCRPRPGGAGAAFRRGRLFAPSCTSQCGSALRDARPAPLQDGCLSQSPMRVLQSISPVGAAVLRAIRRSVPGLRPGGARFRPPAPKTPIRRGPLPGHGSRIRRCVRQRSRFIRARPVRSREPPVRYGSSTRPALSEIRQQAHRATRRVATGTPRETLGKT